MQHVLRSYDVKLIAAALMLVDHIGVFFFPEEAIFRLIGRLSFPLFAWLLVQGEEHTKNAMAYGLRLLGLAIASQFIYNLHQVDEFTFWPPPFNILFTLLLGLLCLRLMRLAPHVQPLIWMGGISLAALTQVEYGAYGLAVILLLRYFQSTVLWWLAWLSVHVIPAVTLLTGGVFMENEMLLFQSPAALAPLILLWAGPERGPKARWFYLFYPVHLLVLYGLAQILPLA